MSLKYHLLQELYWSHGIIISVFCALYPAAHGAGCGIAMAILEWLSTVVDPHWFKDSFT